MCCAMPTIPAPVARVAAVASSRVLVIDDEPALVRMLRRVLEAAGHEVIEALEEGAVVASLAAEPEVVLLDLRLGRSEDTERGGTAWIGEIRRHSPDSEIIVMTGYASIDSAVACMRAGAFDYLEKPFHDRDLVLQRVQSALERRQLRMRNRELEGELDRRSTLEKIVGRSAAMRGVLRTVRNLSQNESNVLLEAESGTGKELIARAVHETSPRRGGPFVPVDCGALPEGLAESELFGYERGAFTGAERSALGLFRSADGGTLFLDEIGELPLLLQSKLLRAIQQREVRPLGSSRSLPVDVRIIAATNRDLEAEVRAGRFRADLFYRLRVVEIEIPPLRERLEDVPALAIHFLDRCAPGSRVTGIEPEALEALLQHPWQGNVRELENRIEAAVALAPGPRLTLADLSLGPSTVVPPATRSLDRVPLSLGAYERACLSAALRQAEGDASRAAELLGIGRSTFYRKLSKNRG
jgi:two-component system response regulator HydG